MKECEIGWEKSLKKFVLFCLYCPAVRTLCAGSGIYMKDLIRTTSMQPAATSFSPVPVMKPRKE